MNASSSSDELSTRVTAAKERNRNKATAQQLVEAGLAPEAAGIQFVNSSEVRSAMDRAHDSKLQTEWQQRNSWDDIVPELSAWLRRHKTVISGLTRVLAEGPWFADRIQKLQPMWRDLYFYSPDGLSGYLVNHDSERGFETIVWGI